VTTTITSIQVKNAFPASSSKISSKVSGSLTIDENFQLLKKTGYPIITGTAAAALWRPLHHDRGNKNQIAYKVKDVAHKRSLRHE
jgi:hypothetical protein